MEHLQMLWSTFLAGLLHFLPNLITIIVIVVLGWLATRLLPLPLRGLLNRTSIDPVAVKYIRRTLTVTVWALVTLMVLDKLGVPVTSLLAVLAATGAAVALAVKDNLSNLASGIVLLFTKPFKAGDYIEVDGIAGTIREIELMHTYLDAVGNMRTAIPNTKMMTATIVNYSAHETRRQDIPVTVAYDTDLTAAREALLAVACSNAMTLQGEDAPEEPRVLVMEYADSAIVLALRLWCRTEDYWELRFAVTEQIKAALDAKGIAIPFPQLDVHVQSAQE